MSDHADDFIWYELLTSDAAGAEAFYRTVVGWGTKPMDSPSGEAPDYSYTLFTVGEMGVAGMMEMTPEMCEKGGAQPCWLGYVGVKDVDATAAQIEQMGGSVYRAPDDIPGVGRFAVVADPHGAVFNIMAPIGEAPEGTPARDTPGLPAWRELHAGNGPEAFDFYSELFGWRKTDSMDMGPLGVYQMFGTGSESEGAMMTKMADTPAPMWVYYFNVNDIEAAINRVKDNGGQIIMGPHEVPGGSCIVQCLDPQGALFALVNPPTHQ